jgi:TolB protein
MTLARSSTLVVGLTLLLGWSTNASAELLMESPRHGVTQLFLMSDDGANLKALTAGPRDSANACWSPDGQHIAFVSTREGSPAVYVMRADGSQQRRVSMRGAMATGNPVWSPNSGQLAFAVHQADQQRLVVLDLASGEQRSLAAQVVSPQSLTWSPDGRELFYTQPVLTQRGDNDLLALEVRTGRSRVVLKGDKGLISDLQWSPDGQHFAYTRAAGRQGVHIHVARADGSGGRVLTQGALNHGSPRWSPDGRWIAFESNSQSGERADVFIVAAEGGDARNLSRHEQEDFDPQWSPDGRSVLFSSFRDGYSHVYRSALDGTVSRVGRDTQYLGAVRPRPHARTPMASTATPAQP